MKSMTDFFPTKTPKKRTAEVQVQSSSGEKVHDAFSCWNESSLLRSLNINFDKIIDSQESSTEDLDQFYFMQMCDTLLTVTDTKL